MLKWVKKNLIFNVDGNSGWMNSHAQIPTVLILEDRLRVYFSTRQANTESKTTFIDLDIKNPEKILYLHEDPILDNGTPGCFDEHGIMPSYVLNHQGIIYLYYIGWSRRTSVPYNNMTGLAVSTDGGITFEKVGPGPILSQNINEPFSMTCPFIVKDDNDWHMVYSSGTRWEEIAAKYEHIYDLKYARSQDGIHWQQDGQSIIPSKDPFEAITRPAILKKHGTYHMWFCYRDSYDFRNGEGSYRIGYAHSTDLKSWEREDNNAGIDVSISGWDSQMLAYPYIVETIYGTYMFYNGNGFGQTGFGFATLSDD